MTVIGSRVPIPSVSQTKAFVSIHSLATKHCNIAPILHKHDDIIKKLQLWR